MNQKKKLAIAITLFLMPGALLYVFLVLYPLMHGFVLSTYRWVTLNQRVFVGIDNFITLYNSRIFWISFRNSLIFMATSTALQIIIGFMFGYFLYLQMRAYKIFRTIYYIPVVLSTVAVGFIWGHIYSPAFGLLKPAMEFIGLGRYYTSPLADPGWALLAVIIAHVWHIAGIQIMLFHAGFMNMPIDVIEMATVDGAQGLKLIYHMVLPLAWEITKTIIILQIIGSLRAFDLIFVMTQGGPVNATEVLPMHMFAQAFRNFNIGLGSAVAVVMFVLSMGLTVIFRKLMNRETLQY